MNIDKRLLVLFAVAASAAVGAVATFMARIRHHRTVRDLQHKTDLKSWENEGGNLAPAAASPARPQP
jgi:hypothetical protein